MSELPVVCLMGPTASGKTDLAVALAERLPCDIISVDSSLVYRGMDIGTAKPDAELLQRAPHRLIDIRDPEQAYSAAEFREDALAHIEEIRGAGRIPLLVGGTMLYFKVLQQGMAAMPAADETVRTDIEEQARQQGWPALHQELQQVDPVAAEKIHPNNPQRITRALEVYRLTGKPLSYWWGRQEEQASLQYPFLSFALMPQDRSVLHQRIARRFQQMLAQGFVEEVQALKQRPGLHAALPSMRAVGYRQIWEYLEGNSDYPQMVQAGLAATRQLAKRQITWLRSWPQLDCLQGAQEASLALLLKKIKV